MRSGSALVIVLAILALAGIGAATLKPTWLHGDSKRAQQSAEVTQRLETAVTRQGAEAAASVAKIAEANAVAPESKARDFIAAEVPVALAKLPAPDPQALLEAERRRAAVMEGRLEEARTLYAAALHRADELARERNAALAARHATDIELQRVAAERLGAERERNQMFLVAGLAVALFVYVKLTHLSPGALAEAVNDIRHAKADPIAALDGVATRTQQRVVSWLAHFKGKA